MGLYDSHNSVQCNVYMGELELYSNHHHHHHHHPIIQHSILTSSNHIVKLGLPLHARPVESGVWSLVHLDNIWGKIRD